MPTYVYRCPEDHCHEVYDVVKPMSEIDELAICPRCGAFASSACRQVTKAYFYGAKVEDAAYDPAFGQVIRSSRHRKDEAKARGWIEVGNEKPEVVEKHFERQWAETREQRWQDAAKVKLYE